MKKKETLTIFKEIGILLVITILAGGLLGLVYAVTKEPIEKAQIKAQTDACRRVMTEASEFEEIQKDFAVISENLFKDSNYSDCTVNTVYTAFDGAHSELGHVLSVTTNKGYGGDICLFIGFDNASNITGISITEIHETPGLGMRAGTELTPEFVGRGALVNEFSYVKNGAVSDSQVEAISGATITTKAVTNAVNAAMYFDKNELKGGM